MARSGQAACSTAVGVLGSPFSCGAISCTVARVRARVRARVGARVGARVRARVGARVGVRIADRLRSVVRGFEQCRLAA